MEDIPTGRFVILQSAGQVCHVDVRLDKPKLVFLSVSVLPHLKAYQGTQKPVSGHREVFPAGCDRDVPRVSFIHIDIDVWCIQ